MDGRVCMFCMLPFGEDGHCGCKPINPFPINFNTGIRTPESQDLIDEAGKYKRKQVRLRKTAPTVLSPCQQTCALQPSLDCLTDLRSTRTDLSDIEDALM